MGFLDNIVSSLGGAAVGFLTGGPAGAVAGGVGGFFGGDTDTPAATTAVATRPPASITGITPVGAPAAAGDNTLAKILQQATLGGLPAAVVGLTGILDPPAVAAAAVGMGKNRVITQVQTFNAAGQLIKQKTLLGRPFLMNRDIVTAKRVFRTIQKASGRLPRRTVKEGKTKQLTDAVMDKALSNVITDNGNGGKC